MDITGHLPDLDFSLTDDNGNPATDKTYRGDVILLYFGFTGCSSQCPAALARLSEIARRLGGDGGRIRVLFVTVNPDNDTPPILHHYLTLFDPRHMTGLTGNERNIAALAQRLRAAYRPGAGGDRPHSNAIYIFDQSGTARLLATPGDADERIIHDVRQLLHAGS